MIKKTIQKVRWTPSLRAPGTRYLLITATLLTGLLALTAVESWQQAAQSPLVAACVAALVLLAMLAVQLGISQRLVRQRNLELKRQIADQTIIRASLARSEDRFRSLFERSPDAVWILDQRGFSSQANAAMLEAFGFSDAAAFKNISPLDLSPPLQEDGTPSAVRAAALLAAASEMGVQRFEWLHRRLDGRCFPAEVTLSILDLEGEPVTFAVVRDISKRRQAETELLRQKTLFQAIVDNAPSLIYMFDPQGRLVLCNQLYEQVVGRTSSELTGQRRDDFMVPADARQQNVHDSAVLSTGQSRRFEDIHHDAQGRAITYLTTKCPLRTPDGNLLGVLGISNDITRLKETQAALERLAHYDAITGLPNRVLFHQRLSEAIRLAMPHDRHVAVLVLDLDGFKTVNDTLGHPTGDLLLREATVRLQRNLRPGDLVARLGGDEFAFVMPVHRQPEEVISRLPLLLACLQEPFDLEGSRVLITASMGLALYPADGSTADALLRHADTAMYAAKEGGRNDYRVYQRHMTQHMQERVSLEHALRRALENQELEVWYQPKLSLADGQLAGAEALLRWRDPHAGLVSPADFIPLAERTGLIVPMGEWLLDQVCAQLRAWRDHDRFDGHVAVNVAVPQIERSDFADTVTRALQRYQLPARLLEVEVTESLFLESRQLARSVLGRLQAMGVTTAVDDFGTGYSSLAYLHLLPVDNLKIDRAFIQELPHSPTHMAITRAIIQLGHALKFRVTAEGIETAEQYEFVRQAGCDVGQGYLIARPMPVADFEAWLAQWPAGGMIV
ncbi:putative bifunctional diguanylate cyclase/phosphodiesterase [Pseudomonas eucalypticola]|uniref:cyclic-guanylate-specific phosphodiesterase n=2 Tax=Pseudomonas TaxID=286 RepID=A0A7D5D7Z9_9PSED|nr:EAL domain-containing protein [Pseudomonas eucalypticola]QKZ05016.1 EAL domain-containing protein [Pseudomonas eucalypticola]